MALDDLMAGVEVPTDVRHAIAELLATKRATPELGTGARIAVLDAWIVERLAALAPERRTASGKGDAHVAATRLFHRSIGFA